MEERKDGMKMLHIERRNGSDKGKKEKEECPCWLKGGEEKWKMTGKKVTRQRERWKRTYRETGRKVGQRIVRYVWMYMKEAGAGIEIRRP